MEYKLLISYVLIIIALLFSYKEKLGIEKQIIVGSLRAFIQLIILGYLLLYIFKISNPIFLSMILIFMTIFAAYTGQNRVKLKEKGFFMSFICIFLSSFIVIGLLLSIKAISFKPNEFIPIGGIIIGNALNTYTLTADKLKGEIENNLNLLENFIALGATLKEALQDLTKNAVKSALIPTLNLLQTIGVVLIPGTTTGMLLAGANPLTAVIYQLLIVYSIVSVSIFTSLITINIGYKFIFISIANKK